MIDKSQIDFDVPFATVSDLIRQHAQTAPQRLALAQGAQTQGAPIDGVTRLTYGELDALMDRVAVALQRDGVKSGDSIALCAQVSVNYAAVFLGALRAGVVVAPLAPGSTAESLVRMVQDAQAKLVFTDVGSAGMLGEDGVARVMLDDLLGGWLAEPGAVPQAVAVEPTWPFNIIYSSGTTGEPKGIVQSHGMRWMHVRRGGAYGYDGATVTLLSTPLYSNTTLVVFFPTLGFGGTVVLMPKFEAQGYLQLAQEWRVTHTMLVPVQYQRIMSLPSFASFDLSSFKVKFCTSAPFAAALKADVLARWPGGLVEFYGMTEGGGSFILDAHLHPDKLHTVGRAAQGHDIRLIDEAGVEVAPGEAGEVVGHSPGMMIGYHRQPAKTREAEWFDTSGKRFIRTGDIGRLDAEGFLTLFDRRKDMIISGGFNIYPSDLEAILHAHASVLEAAVVGMPSEQWGETPVAFVVLRAGQLVQKEDLLVWLNTRVGKTQRASSLNFVDELPRSAIGKVLKRELRDRLATSQLQR